MSDAFVSLISIQPAGSAQTEYGSELDRRGPQNNNSQSKSTAYVQFTKWRLFRPACKELGPVQDYNSWLTQPVELGAIVDSGLAQVSLTKPTEIGSTYSLDSTVASTAPTQTYSVFSTTSQIDLTAPVEDSFIGYEVFL